MHKNNKKTQMVLGIIVITVFLVGGGFYAGMKYGQSSRSSLRGQFGGGVGQQGGRGFGRAGAGVASGEVVSLDDKSMTVKLRDGGSRIVFFSGTTQVSKSATGSMQDVAVGSQVVAAGDSNQDGSVNARTIQIRPGMPSTNQ